MDSQEPTPPGASETYNTNPSEELKPTSKGVENAKKRLRAFSIQKKSLSPVTIPLPKPICTNVGAVGTVFIGKLASAKSTLKPGDIEEVVDPKKPPKPPKPGTSKQQNADYLNSQKKTLCEIEAMKRKMELVDLGIPLGLICPAPDEKAMPTKAMPPIKSMMLDPAKVDEIIREAKKARAEGKTFKFSYEKLLPSYQNPFARKDKQKLLEKERDRDGPEDRQARDRRRLSDNYRRRNRDRPEDKDRRRVTRERDDKDKKRRDDRSKRSKEREKSKDREARSKDRDIRSKEKDESAKEDVKSKDKDSKSKGKIDTINLSDDDDVEFVTNIAAKGDKETDVNLKDFVVCDSWSENEEKKDSTPKADKKEIDKSKAKPIVDPIDHLKDVSKERPLAIKIGKLRPVTDSFKFEIEDENDEETLDIFSENASIEEFAKIPLPSIPEPYSPSRFDYESKDISVDGMDESFLESVIAEIKQEDIDEDIAQDKGLVEYDISPKDDRESITPEIDDRIRELYSSRSDCSDGLRSTDSGIKSTESGYKSTESGYKSTEGGYKSTETGYKSTERSKSTDSNDSRSRSSQSHKPSDSRAKSVDSHKSTESGYKSTESGRKSTKPDVDAMSKAIVDSLETWSFVMKICQPLLFRHDRNKCYKETRSVPKVWFAENPKGCDCVKDRSVVYEELEMCKMDLVDTVYRNDQVPDAPYPAARGWYPAKALSARGAPALASEWEAEDSQERPTPPRGGRLQLDLEYQKFMEAVWPEVDAVKSETPPKTPLREGWEGSQVKKRPAEETEASKKKKAKIDRMSSEGWSQESEVEEVVQKIKKQKLEKVKRKRKHSPSASDSENESPSKKKKERKEKKEKLKTKAAIKRQRLGKKYLKKLKEKQEKQLRKKKKLKLDEEAESAEREKKKREKKLKKKKLLKQKKKAQKKKKARTSSSSTSESDRKSKRDKRKKRKRKQSTSESNQSDELFDVNILKNIKTERLTDDEKPKNFSPKKHREIINVKQLQNDFVSIQIKKEVEDVNSPEAFEESFTEDEKREIQDVEKMEAVKREEVEEKSEERTVEENAVVKETEVLDKQEVKQPDLVTPPTQKPQADDTTQSSQDSVISVKEYEKDESHLRPSSQNSNYNFHDVMESGGHDMERQTELYGKEGEMEMGYEQGNYEMYEQMAMEYQSDVASQRVPPPDEQTSGRIETVALTRNRGEIKCDWRAGDPPEPAGAAPRALRWDPQRPSRWGLKPSEVNIVLTGRNDPETTETFAIERAVSPTVYKIQSLANRTDSNTGYDEAYMDMYGASDRLQYGDCFSQKPLEAPPPTLSSLDERINRALGNADLDDMVKEDTERDEPDKGILMTKCLADPRNVKRVSFADGYKPGQDSDTEDPPVRKRRLPRRRGAAWPLPAAHPDHVPLWDALPPPPPPPGSPPPPPRAPPPLHLLRQGRAAPHPPLTRAAPQHMPKFESASLAGFMPPEPPPGLISF